MYWGRDSSVALAGGWRNQCTLIQPCPASHSEVRHHQRPGDEYGEGEATRREHVPAPRGEACDE